MVYGFAFDFRFTYGVCTRACLVGFTEVVNFKLVWGFGFDGCYGLIMLGFV